MRMTTFEHRIGVIGLTQVGKTVFITSLLDHWQASDPSRFDLRRADKQIDIFFRWRPGIAGDKTRQLFERHRSKLENGEWPEKSLRNDRYCVDVKLPGEWLWRHVTLFDLPGERMADVEILRRPRLSDWSDEVRHRIAVDTSLQNAAAAFLRLYDGQCGPVPSAAAELDQMGKAYQSYLANMIRENHPMVSPSSILIDAHGRYVPDTVLDDPNPLRLIDWLSTEAECGLQHRPLFPVPERLRNTQEGKRIAATYRDYRSAVVLPALAQLASCQDVLVLVDVAAVLENGPAWKNTHSRLLRSIVEFISPGGWAWRWLKSLAYRSSLGWFWRPHARRITFVATQMDRVHPDHHNSLRKLLWLLSRQATKAKEADGELITRQCLVSAIKSTYPKDGQLVYDRRGAEGIIEGVSEPVVNLPDEFGEEWPIGSYQFPRPMVKMPRNRDVPPRQYGLDTLTASLLGL